MKQRTEGKRLGNGRLGSIGLETCEIWASHKSTVNVRREMRPSCGFERESGLCVCWCNFPSELRPLWLPQLSLVMWLDQSAFHCCSKYLKQSTYKEKRVIWSPQFLEFQSTIWQTYCFQASLGEAVHNGGSAQCFTLWAGYQREEEEGTVFQCPSIACPQWPEDLHLGPSS
jgi:hypothetical protein